MRSRRSPGSALRLRWRASDAALTPPASFKAARALAFALPLALLLGALGSQYLGGLYPCEMCHWQRWPHYAAVALAGLAFLFPHRAPVALAGVLIVVSGAIGVFHAGVEYGWWEGITACASTIPAGGAATMDELLDRIMKAPLIRCDLPQWTFLGISLAGFNALLSIPGGLAVLVLLGQRKTA